MLSWMENGLPVMLSWMEIYSPCYAVMGGDILSLLCCHGWRYTLPVMLSCVENGLPVMLSWVENGLPVMLSWMEIYTPCYAVMGGDILSRYDVMGGEMVSLLCCHGWRYTLPVMLSWVEIYSPVMAREILSCYEGDILSLLCYHGWRKVSCYVVMGGEILSLLCCHWQIDTLPVMLSLAGRYSPCYAHNVMRNQLPGMQTVTNLLCVTDV